MNSLYLWYLAQWVNVLGTVAAIGGGGLAAWKAISEWKRATLQRADELRQREEELQQRKQEFRQKQAVFARDTIKDIFADKRAFNALTMLDFDEYDFEDVEKRKRHHIVRQELQPVLRMDSIGDPAKETFIRRSFEGLYDHLEQVQNLLDVDVLNLADIETTFRYYMRSALEPDIEHLKFFEDFDYPGTARFMKTLASSPPRSSKTSKPPSPSSPKSRLI
jgi:hypothetical protein